MLDLIKFLLLTGSSLLKTQRELAIEHLAVLYRYSAEKKTAGI